MPAADATITQSGVWLAAIMVAIVAAANARVKADPLMKQTEGEARGGLPTDWRLGLNRPPAEPRSEELPDSLDRGFPEH